MDNHQQTSNHYENVLPRSKPMEIRLNVWGPKDVLMLLRETERVQHILIQDGAIAKYTHLKVQAGRNMATSRQSLENLSHWLGPSLIVHYEHAEFDY